MESRFARPLIERFLAMDTPMSFGLGKIAMGARIHRYCVEGQGRTVCLDYSKYDSTVTRTMILQSFRILSTWFSEEERKELGWSTVVKYFISTPIVMPDGMLYVGKDHGVPSGSYFTQMIDSIVNVALMYALQYQFHFDIAYKSLNVLGDDVIVNIKGPFDVSQWRSFLLKQYGVMLHDDEKTQVGPPHYLGAYWFKGKPDLPIQELVNKATFPEKFRNYQGKPDSGARGVLASYASSYLSAHRFLPTGLNLDPRSKNWMFPFRHDLMTGSDKYLYEEKGLLSNRPVSVSTLTTRLLS
jgi:hypothetical protein